MFRIRTVCGTRVLLSHNVSICHDLPNPFLAFLLPSSANYARKGHTFVLLRPLFTCFLGCGHIPSVISLHACFSAQTFQKFCFHQMIVFTSSRHVSFKFKFLTFGDTITSFLGQFIPQSSSCDLTEFLGLLHSFQLTCLICVFPHCLHQLLFLVLRFQI